MTGRSYINEVNPQEVTLAIEQLLIAPEGTAWTPARIDVDAPPSGFVHLGAVVEDSPAVTVTREKFELDTGIPRIRQFEVTTGMNGTFACQLHSSSWRKIQYALGNYTAISSHTVVTSIASVTNRNVITLTTTSASLNVGRQIVISANTLATGFDKADAIETQIASIHSDGLTLFLQPTPVRTPTVNYFVGYYGKVTQAIGTARNTYYSLLGVADLLTGEQIVHEIRKAAPGAEWNETITPDANMRIPLSFTAFGFAATDVPGAGGASELIVMYRHQFPRLT